MISTKVERGTHVLLPVPDGPAGARSGTVAYTLRCTQTTGLRVVLWRGHGAFLAQRASRMVDKLLGCVLIFNKGILIQSKRPSQDHPTRGRGNSNSTTRNYPRVQGNADLPKDVVFYFTRTRLFPSSSLLLGQRGKTQVGLDDAEVGEQLLGLLVLDGGVDNDIVAGDPVDGGGDLVLVARLQAVDDAQDLGRVAAGGGRVGQDGADGLLGVDDEDGADREGDALLVDVGCVLVVEPVGIVR